MKKNNDYVNDFVNAYNAMRNRAVEVIKNYGKTLWVGEVLQSRLMRENGWSEWPMSGSEEWDSIEEEVEEWKYNEMYWCAFTGKHGEIYDGYISMVRWNAEKGQIDVFFDSNDGAISEWLPESYIEFDRDSIFRTILEFID